MTISKTYWKQLLGILIMLIVAFPIVNESMSVKMSTTVLGTYLIIVYVLSMFTWLFVSKKASSIYFFFLVYCLLSNAGQIILHTLNIEFSGVFDLYELYSVNIIKKTILFQCKCVIALSIGALLAWNTHFEQLQYKNDGKKTFINLDFSPRSKQILMTDVIYVALYCLVLVEYISKMGMRMSMNYGEFYYSEDTSTAVDIRVRILYHAFLYLSLWNHREYKSKARRNIYIATIAMCIFMLAVGSRSLIIPSLIGIVFIKGLNILRTKQMTFIKIVWICAGVVFIFVLLQGIHSLRQYSLNDISVEVVMEAYGSGLFESVVDAIQEMGGSARCVAQTIYSVDMHLVPKEDTLIYALLKGFFPTGILSFLEPNIGYLSEWVTEIGSGEKTAAWGYSIIAEAYFNYGSNGYIAMLIFGCLYVLSENFVKTLLNNGYVVAGFAGVYVLTYLVFSARSELLLYSSEIRYFVYILIFSYVYRMLKNMNKLKV